MFCGVFLILFGALLLLDNTGLLPVGVWELFWPALLIALGVAMVAGWPALWCRGCWPQGKGRD